MNSQGRDQPFDGRIDKMIVRWKSVVGYEGIYEVSSDGQIKRLKRITIYVRRGNRVLSRITEKILIGTINRCGYIQVCIPKDGKCRARLVHQLVALTWIGERPEGKQINHKDGDKTNNQIENLEYVTSKENIRHAVANGLTTNTKATDQQLIHGRQLIQSGVTIKEAAERVGISIFILQRFNAGKSRFHLLG